jgi:hypothetical protein
MLVIEGSHGLHVRGMVCGGGHPKMPPFMHQATSLSSFPYFFSFQLTSFRVSHFPHFRLATSYRHHVPRSHADNEMAFCANEDTYKCYRPHRNLFQGLFVHACFVSGRSRHAPLFRGVRNSHYSYMHVAHEMPRFSLRPRRRAFRLSACRAAGEAVQAAF